MFFVQYMFHCSSFASREGATSHRCEHRVAMECFLIRPSQAQEAADNGTAAPMPEGSRKVHEAIDNIAIVGDAEPPSCQFAGKTDCG